MQIKQLTGADKQRTRALYEEVFPEDSQSFVDYYYSEKVSDNLIYAGIEEGQIVSMLHLNPYMIMVNNTPHKLHYIVAVATKKEYRGRGYMRSLLTKAMQDMNRSGEIFTYLMPVAEAIYTPHDFRTVYHQQISYYQPDEKLDDEIIAAELDDEDVYELADSVNNYRYRNDFQVYTHVDPAYYLRYNRELHSDGGVMMTYKRSGTIVDARPYVSGELMRDPKIMVRILDLFGLLSLLRTKTMIGICFEVTDDLIADNNTVVMLYGTPMEGISISTGRRQDSEGIISIRALTGFLFGEKTIDELTAAEDVVMSERMKRELDKIYPLTRIRINEVV